MSAPASNIRPYNADELESVIAIFRSNIPKYFGRGEEAGLRSFLEGESSRDYYVVEVNGEVVGCGGIALNNDQTVSLCWGMVREDHHGKGLGKSLTDFRVRLSGEKYPGVPLVTSTSQHTQGFYEKFGFRLTEHEPDGFGPGIDICKMRLDHLPANGRE